MATHPVAVGSAQWPTQTGEWTIKQMVFNPEWVPPDDSWAEEREPRKSGDPKRSEKQVVDLATPVPIKVFQVEKDWHIVG